MIFKDLRPIKKVYFIVLLIISCVSFFYAYKYYKLSQNEYMYGLGALGTILFGYSIYVLLNSDNQKTCNSSLWSVKKNVILPSDIGEPVDTDVTLCDAQTIAEYGDTLFFSKKSPGFYYDGSNVYTVDNLDDTVNISTSNTNVSFYYLKGEKITTRGGGSGTTTTTTTTPTTTTTTTATTTTSCCYRGENDSCITFEQTYLGNIFSNNENFKKVFVNRAGNTIGISSEEYIGDFTILNNLNNTTRGDFEILNSMSIRYMSPSPSPLPSPSLVRNSKETVELQSFSWPDCSPNFIKNMKPKMTKSLSQINMNIVLIDTWLIYTVLQGYIYITKNGSINSFYPIRGGPWKKAMEIKIEFNNPVFRYNGKIYLHTEIEELRDLLIAE